MGSVFAGGLQSAGLCEHLGKHADSVSDTLCTARGGDVRHQVGVGVGGPCSPHSQAVGRNAVIAV